MQRGVQCVGDLKILALPGAASLAIDVPDADRIVIRYIGESYAGGGHVVDELDSLARQQRPHRLHVAAGEIAPAAAWHTADCAHIDIRRAADGGVEAPCL